MERRQDSQPDVDVSNTFGWWFVLAEYLPAEAKLPERLRCPRTVTIKRRVQ
jgi:hypothetical protein